MAHQKKIRCLIIEDDAIAIDMLRDYIGRRQELDLVATIKEKGDIQDALKTFAPQIVFLDLIIPDGKVSDFNFTLFPKHICIIIVSAVSAKHFDGSTPPFIAYELLKPVSYEKFNRCIQCILKKSFRRAY